MTDLPTISRDEAEAGRYFDCRGPKVIDLMRSREPTLLISGPAGTGKTRSILEKIRACCLKYPNSRWLLLRSVRKWLTQSALVTWEEKVIVGNELVPDQIRRDFRSEYRFVNGSRVVVAGLDDPQQVMSAEYDGAFICEATEIPQETMETVANRLRYQRMPYQQLLMDCNPGPSTHWLKRESDAGRFRRIDTTHKDNPAYYDQEKQQWTKAGELYMQRLDTLTGTRRLRLRDGIWASAEGVVYTDWSSAIHVIDRLPATVTKHWPRYWAVDFGYTDPFVWQEWIEDGDGRAYLNREIYMTKTLVEDHAARIRELTKDSPRPREVICDHDAEGRATLERHLKIITVPAPKAIDAGIQDVAKRLVAAGDGRPRLFLFRDALDQIDPDLKESSRPWCTAQEFDGYIWDTRGGRRRGDVPVDKDNHGMDACLIAGTMVETVAGPLPIEDVRAGDLVLTRKGYRPVVDAWMSNPAAEVCRLELSNGASIVGTGNHPVFADQLAFIRMDALRYGMRVSVLSENLLWNQKSSNKRNGLRLSGIGTSTIGGIRALRCDPTVFTSERISLAGKWAGHTCTAISGRIETAQSQMGGKSTTRTTTHSTTRQTIWKRCLRWSTPNTTSPTVDSGKQSLGRRLRNTSVGKCWRLLQTGIARLKAGLGIPNMANWSALPSRLLLTSAPFAAGTFRFVSTLLTGPSFVPVTAERQPGEGDVLTMRGEFARVGESIFATGTRGKSDVPCRVVRLARLPVKQAVFNLSVEGCPEYYANGVLVHNCRYFCRHRASAPTGKPSDISFGPEWIVESAPKGVFGMV